MARHGRFLISWAPKLQERIPVDHRLGFLLVSVRAVASETDPYFLIFIASWDSLPLCTWLPTCRIRPGRGDVLL